MGGGKLTYSTDERTVGTQIDGKPIYCKVIPNLNLKLEQDSKKPSLALISTNPLISGVEQFINVIGYSDDSALSLPVEIYPDGSKQWIISFDVNTINTLLIEYTKLSD